MDRAIRNDSLESACAYIWVITEFIDYGRGELFYGGKNLEITYYSYYEDFSDEFKLKLLQIMGKLELKFAA